MYGFGLGVDVLRQGTDTPIPKKINASQGVLLKYVMHVACIL